MLMKLTRNELTPGQTAKLNRWERDGMPTECIKLGYSVGSRGNNNFHSTWAFRDGNIENFPGDSRSTWRRFVKKYGYENIG
jgi:hypothetical protein